MPFHPYGSLWYAAALALTLLLTGLGTYWGAAASFSSGMQERLDSNALKFQRLVGAQAAGGPQAGGPQPGVPRHPFRVTSTQPAERVLPLLAEVRGAGGLAVSRSIALDGADLPTVPADGRLAIVPFHGARWAVAGWPLDVGGRVYELELAAPWGPTAATLASLRRLLLLVAIAGALLALAGGAVLSRAAVADIDAIRRAAEEIGATDLSKRLPLAGTGDELDRMAQSFNDLLERVEESYSRQTRFVAEASHELRTPTTVIRGVSAMLLRWGAERPEVLRDSLTTIQRQSEHLSHLVNDLLVLARGDLAGPDRRQRVDLCRLAVEAAQDASWSAGGRTILVDPRQSAVVHGDAVRLRQMLDALLDNAVRFTGAAGQVRIGVEVRDGEVHVAVADDGPGFGAADLPRVFDRFFRGEAQPSGGRGGAGLGLAIARAVVEGHEGSIGADNAPGGGARIWVRLPLAAGDPGAACA